MMQKVRGLVSAFLCFNNLFHFSFSVPLRYFFCSFSKVAFSVSRTWAVKCFGLYCCGYIRALNVVIIVLVIKLAIQLRGIQFAWMSSRCKGDA